MIFLNQNFIKTLVSNLDENPQKIPHVPIFLPW
jgi:hypothetical protein